MPLDSPKPADVQPTNPTVVITTGVPKGPIVSRLELRTFLEDKDVTNLYLLALQRMQRTDQNDPTSWFQVASIHGRPYEPWNNVGSKPQKIDFVEGGRTGGYCTHSSILFPPWHRPYMALFEQILSKHVYDIAESYVTKSEREKYLAAAERFRVPYWDWAAHPELPHIVASDKEVTVHTPFGIHTIKNPLYSYDFHPVPDGFGGRKPSERRWLRWQSTVRYPTNEELNATSQEVKMQRELELMHRVTRDKTYMLLTQSKRYGSFSNDSFELGQDPISYNNIESIHNDIHGFAGEIGHMGEVDYAAFDPVFWLHHANVDRIFAIWQALNPTEYVSSQENESGTWTTKPGSIETAKTPLTPFRAPAEVPEDHCTAHPTNSSTTADKFWNSDGVINTHTFRYTYPELKRSAKIDDDSHKTNLRADIIRLYGSPVVERLLDAYYENGQKVSAIPAPVDIAAGVTSNGPGEPKFKLNVSKFPHGHWHNTETKDDDKLHYHEWLANIAVKKYEINTSFKIHVFLGKPDTDSSKWSSDPNLVGTQVVFTNDTEVTGCGRCIDGEARGQSVTGTIPLTTFLGNRFQGKNLQLEPKQVVPYLKKKFTWRVQKLDNTHIEVPSLRITIVQALVEVPEPGLARVEFPVVTETITEGGTHDT